MKLLFATTNISKVNKFKENLKKYNVDLMSLNNINNSIEVEENGESAIENALIKVRAYNDLTALPTMAIEESLYIDGLPEELEPGVFIRNVNDKRLSDDEMFEYYTKLVKKYGTNGELTARWNYALAIYFDGEEYTYTWDSKDFKLVSTLAKRRNPGNPLNSMSKNIELDKYFVDMTKEDIKATAEDDSEVINFIVSTLGMLWKYIILDFGDVLVKPATGYWFITPTFKQLIDMNKLDIPSILESMKKYNHVISRKMTTLDEEYTNFQEFYTSVFKDNNLNIKKDIIAKISHDITYGDDKYIIYDDVIEQLERLSSKYTLILLTDNWPCLDRIMKKLEIDKYFDRVYSSSEFGFQKKDGVLFDHVINDYEISGNALYIDNDENLLDIGAVKGLEVMLMDRKEEKEESKYIIIHSLKEIE